MPLQGGPNVNFKPTISKTAAGAQYVAESPDSLTIVGFVGGQTVTTKAATFTFPAFGNNFAAVTLTPLDRKPLAQSHHLLLTLVGKVENQDMHWNAAHTSVGNQWGHAPTMAEGIPAHVHVSGQVGLRMYALDANGRRAKEVPNASSIVINGGTVLGSPSDFNVGPQYQTVWYEIGG